MLPVRRAVLLTWTSSHLLQASLIRYCKYTQTNTVLHTGTSKCQFNVLKHVSEEKQTIMEKWYLAVIFVCVYTRTTMGQHGPSFLTTRWAWPVEWCVPHQSCVWGAATCLLLRRDPLISEGCSSLLPRYSSWAQNTYMSCIEFKQL